MVQPGHPLPASLRYFTLVGTDNPIDHVLAGLIRDATSPGEIATPPPRVHKATHQSKTV
jgi:hypothetical protein